MGHLVCVTLYNSLIYVTPTRASVSNILNYYRVSIVSVLYSYNSRSSYVLTQGSLNLFEKTQVPH